MFGNTSIDFVKNGVFNFDKSVTLQHALEGNVFIRNPQWNSFEDNQKRVIVEFTAGIDTSITSDIAEYKNGQLTRIPVEITIQFYINKDNTFDARFLELSTPIGPLFVPETLQGVINTIDILYNNKIPNITQSLRNLFEKGLIDAVNSNNMEVARYLIDRGANLHAKTIYGWNLLSIAANNGNSELLKLLIAQNVDVNGGDLRRETPLFKALKKGHQECVYILVENGANVNIINENYETPLSFAVRYNHNNFEVVKLLLNHGAKVNIQNNYGETPLVLAARGGYLDVICVLLEYGAKITGNTLQSTKNADVKKFLQEYMIDPKKAMATKKVEKTPNKNIVMELASYAQETSDSFTRAEIIRYSDTEFNLEIEGSDQNMTWVCQYKNICTQSENTFICKGEMIEDPSTRKMFQDEVSGKIEFNKFVILESFDMAHCGVQGSLLGEYKKLSQGTPKKYTLRKGQIKPIELQEGDSIYYYVEGKNGEGFTLLAINNVEILDKFKNTWIDIEYINYSEYYEPAGENIDFNILYKVNGNNPLEMQR